MEPQEGRRHGICASTRCAKSRSIVDAVRRSTGSFPIKAGKASIGPIFFVADVQVGFGAFPMREGPLGSGPSDLPEIANANAHGDAA